MAQPRSEQFVRGVEEFLNSALPRPVSLAIVETDGVLRAGPTEGDQGAGFALIPLGDGAPAPLLKVEFSLSDDESGRFCRVNSSTFGLFVPLDRKPGHQVPVIRVEYQRAQVPPAHVHFHTSSQPLGWVYGIVGGNYRRSEELHFPVGSERFRPTIEDFLLFLDRERLFRDWRVGSNWRKAARQRLAEYERTQAVSTVRHYPNEMADELRVLGWRVEPPAP